MKIIFDLRNVGLGDNGGSLTLVKSGNTLTEMGHDVYFVDSGKNKHTWTPLKSSHLVVKNEKQLPDADVIIATGYKSVGKTLNAPRRCGIKAHWIRGWETWQMPEHQIVMNVLKAPTIKLVNSICLQNKLHKYHVKSEIIRPGYDLDELYCTHKRVFEGVPITIGGLYTKGKHEKIKRTEWIFQTYLYLKGKEYKVELWMFGANKPPLETVDRFFLRPDMEQKLWMYNYIDIWLAPAMQEGLHMPPAEAMMTECPVVSTNAEMSGTQDYMVHGSTGLVSHNNLSAFMNCVETLVKDEFKTREMMGFEARKKIESLGGREYNMQKLVDYIRKIK